MSHSEFSKAVMGCLPPRDWKITEELVTADGREDLRELVVVSIDPPGCKDIDDGWCYCCCCDYDYLRLLFKLLLLLL